MEARDANLLRGLRTGEPDTFAPVVEAYQGPLLAFALRLLGSRADAEDAVQEAFLRAYRWLNTAPPAWRRNLNLRAWLYRITLNECRRIAGRRRPHLSLDGVGPLVYDPEPRDALLLHKAVQALQAMSVRHRSALLLRVVHNLSYEDTAEALGVPVGTAKSLVHRALKHLQKVLAKERGERQ
ncbi:MAG: RNA polymerase sigma factor [Dehalococcoidia bacterium]